jgi:hypothetical protein
VVYLTMPSIAHYIELNDKMVKINNELRIGWKDITLAKFNIPTKAFAWGD